MQNRLGDAPDRECQIERSARHNLADRIVLVSARKKHEAVRRRSPVVSVNRRIALLPHPALDQIIHYSRTWFSEVCPQPRWPARFRTSTSTDRLAQCLKVYPWLGCQSVTYRPDAVDVLLRSLTFYDQAPEG